MARADPRADAWHRARAAWPRFTVPRERFVERGGEAPANAEDLYLAIGCELGLKEAVAAFEREVLAQVPLYLPPRQRANADELVQRLRVRLLVGSPPQISQYTGRGSLGGFVRVAAVRLARDAERGKKESAKESLPDVAASMPDPELAYLRRRHAADFKSAFEEVLGALPAEDRNILSLHLLDALTTDAIGKLYGVDGSTIRRRVARLRETIVKQTGRALMERLGVKSAELQSLFGLVRSELDLSLRKHLGKP